MKSKGLFFILLLVSLLCTICASPATARAQTITLPVEITNIGVFVTVEVNSNPVRLLIDTGATNTVVTPRAGHFAEATLQKSTVTEGHTQQAVSFTLTDVKVGDRQFSNILVVVTPLNSQVGDGLLGQNVLRLFKSVTLDYSAKTLVLVK